MTRTIKRKIPFAGLFVLFCCCLSGCSFSFCGFPVGDREELVFTCEEGLPEISREALPEEKTQDTAGGEALAEAGATETAKDGKVDLNAAGLEELMTLNGIGESRAKAIIEYREQKGSFQRIEDIMQVPGIKEGIFSKIKEQIAVH